MRRLAMLLAACVAGALAGFGQQTNQPPPAPPVVRAPTPEEVRAFNSIAKLFEDGIFDLVDRDSNDFTKQFPNSERLSEIVLFQGQARVMLRRYPEAIALLTERMGIAGKFADEFRFWLAEARYRNNDLAGGADGFAQVVAEFPNSARRLEACFHEAFARFRLGQVDRTLALMRDANGAFQQAAKARPEDEWSIRGWLLLAEVLVLRKDVGGAQEALKQLEGRKLPPDLGWQRHFLWAQAQLMAERYPEALAHATNLWTAATNAIPADVVAIAVGIHGEIHERLGQPDAALAVYERNLADGTPSPHRRNALRRIIEISLAQNKQNEIAQRLETFITQHPSDESLDIARLALGELRLKEYYAIRQKGPPATAEARTSLSNLLAGTRNHFDLVVSNFSQSPVVGRAQLNRGWCLWEEGPARLPDGLLAFQGASERLTDPAEGAVARFKWADCQFLTKDHVGAISNYWLSVTNAVRSGSPTNSLVTQALYQIVRASIEANDLQSASLAMAEILARDPGGDLADRTELLVGQALNRQGNPLAARNRYLDFVQRFTNSALLPEVKIAIARTYEREHNLDAAIKEYSAWLGSYAGLASVPPPMIAQASFELARLSYQAQPNAPALNLLTNFVSKFPDHTNAPLAQYMIGEYYFGQGDYEKAELHFQDKVLFQNTNALFANLTYHARLMAGRAAVAGQRHRSARDYFDWLITNGPLHVASSPVPVSLVAQAYLFRGDTFLAEGGGGITNSLARFGEAITAFSKVAEHFPTNEFTPIAWGRIGDCHLQLATEDPAQAVTRYQNALAAYRRVVDSTAPVATRSQAEVGLGIVCEKLARLRPAAEQRVLLDEALDRYMRVFHTKNLRGGEQPDPYWVRAGGMAAAELAESQSKWDQAVAVYKRLQTELPSLRERLQKKIDQATKAREASGSAK